LRALIAPSLAFGLMVAPANAQVSANMVDVQMSGAERARTAQATDVGQISTVSGRADMAAGQIAAPRKAAVIDAGQLTNVGPTAEATPSLSSKAEGRNTRVGMVGGHDRCDAAAGASADRSGCDRIPDGRADEFGAVRSQNVPIVVDPDAPAPDLVDDIVNGGTGTVVSVPK
jgi:hypothetical protein